MKLTTLLRGRKFRVFCYIVLTTLYLVISHFYNNRKTIVFRDVFLNPAVPEKMPSLFNGFGDHTMNTPLNMFFEEEEKGLFHKTPTVYGRSIKKWVYKKDFQQRLSYYFSSMIKDYHKEKCSDLIRVYPANKPIQKNVFIEEFDQPSFTAIFVTNHLRIHMIPSRIKQWKGPAIFVIYISSDKQASMVTEYLLQKDFSEDIQIYTYEGKEGCFDSKHFPINKLRNIAIQYVQTTHYVVLDMDIIISKNPQAALMRVPSLLWQDYHSVAILPIFFLTSKAVDKEMCKTLKNCTEVSEAFAPRTVSELKVCIDARKCRIGKENLHTHDYVSNNWLSGQKEPERLGCLSYKGIEPYVVLRHHPRMPMYDPIFYDYGGNKQIFIERLRFFSSEWFVLSDVFGIDLIHPKSSYRLRYDDDFSKSICINPFLVFLRSYELRYDNEPLMPFCK